jgi:hypothetical protein
LTDPRTSLYADVDPDVAAQLEAMLAPQAMAPPGAPAPAPGAWTEADFDGRRTYLHLTQDQVLLPKAQRAMIEKSGVKWNVVEMDTSHSPFASRPKEVVKIVQDLTNTHNERTV